MKETKNFKVGDTASMIAEVTDKVIAEWADLTGDYNPVHMDDEYAEKTRFKKRIVHGLFCQGMVSNLIGNVLPGNGSILINEKINYNRPVYIGDRIECICTINNIIEDKNRFIIGFDCINQNGKNVLDGEAEVLI